MIENINEALEQLDLILEYLEETNHDDRFHIVLELGHQLRDELVANAEE
jgi:hypothetical protein